MFLFLFIDVETTWIVASHPSSPVMHHDDGSFKKIVIDAMKCNAIVSWNTREQIIKFIPSFAEMILIEPTIPQDSKNAKNAKTVMDAYFSIDSGLLPDGNRPSVEQWNVSNAAGCGNNILCRAVAGAGKTTALLLCAARSPKQSHLLLTYNKRLQIEVAQRAKTWEATSNVTVMTYHAAAGKSYGTIIRNDDQFRKFVCNIPETPLHFDVLLIDEAQDMSIEYFVLMRHLLRANLDARIIIVGDELQSINEYRGANPGFLTDAPIIYHDLVKGKWISCRLGISHRLTPATAAFVNAHLYRAPVIIGGNLRDDNIPPVYLAVSGGKDEIAPILAKITKESIKKFGASGIFILAPSVRNLTNSKSPIAELIRCHLIDIPIFVGGDDDSQIDEKLIKEKLAILSFNAVKGCERPCVILVGFDESYFLYFNREWTEKSKRLPNVLTVAATRAIKCLILVTSAKKTLRSIDMSCLSTLAKIKGEPSSPKIHKPIKRKHEIIPVTTLVRHLHPEIIRDAMEFIISTIDIDVKPRIISRIDRFIKFVYKNESVTEDLTFVYGILAPVLAEVARRGETDFGVDYDSPKIVMKPQPYTNQITRKEYDAYPLEFWELISSALSSNCCDRSIQEWVVIAIAVHAFHEGRHHIARQVTNYDWVNNKALLSAADIVKNALAEKKGVFEVRCEITIKDTFICAEVVGRADFIEDNGIIWEFKLGELCEEHELQLACYIAVRGGGEGRLMSIKNQETRRITVDPKNAINLLTTLCKSPSNNIRSVTEIIAEFDKCNENGILFFDNIEIKEPTDSWSLDDVMG